MSKPRRVAIMLDLDWPYKRHAGIFAGTQQYAQEHDWLSTMDEYVAETLSMCSPRSIPYDGIIARATRKLARRAARLNIPLVNVWQSSPVWKSLPCVFPDFAAIGRLGAEHLLSRGFTRFAAFLDDDDLGQKLELKAFARTLGKSGFSCTNSTWPLDTNSFKDWQKVIHALTNAMNSWSLPIGVFVGADREGRLLAQLCRNRGWRVPADVAIITGGNEEIFCEGLHPTLTSVELGYERVGYEAAKLLERMMNGEAPPAQPIVLPPTGLMVRESTDFTAVENQDVAAALQFIAENFHKPISRDEVARAVGISAKSLQSLFKQHMIRPVSDEIRHVRIERAKRELANGTRSMAEIARVVGFGVPMRMYEVFVRELGVTPSQYRKERRMSMKSNE